MLIYPQERGELKEMMFVDKEALILELLLTAQKLDEFILNSNCYKCAHLLMQQEVRRRRSASRSKIVYKPENSPSHFKRPAYYLKQLRDNGDFRLCDIELVTDNGCENVHSAIAAAHCTKIAKVNSNVRQLDS
ncbi:unnamed protein product [Cylicostephanus goldi]|uniref:BTB domain-containing protein n=1 Tax=Cylicostephanus goldi TaxID=71465 RepID=A0A3P6T0D1_CYLGO|nr:unnamed protein product [Cylicostephanus goldi]